MSVGRIFGTVWPLWAAFFVSFDLEFAICFPIKTFDASRYQRIILGGKMGGDERRDEMTQLRSRKNEEEDMASSRRRFLASVGMGMMGWSSVAMPSHAGELGAKITKMVTQSDLGISVRKSVVKGAQIADQWDGQWEKFSDTYQLGSERSKRPSKPKPKEIPPLQPLNSDIALQILQASDKAFLLSLDSTKDVTPKDLQSQISKVENLVRKSFERSGLNLANSSSEISIQTADQFNFYSYVRYKAYCDLLVEKQVSFPKFKQNFERMLGQQLLPVLLTTTISNASGSSKEETVNQILSQIDAICKNLQSYGLVALAERSSLEDNKDAIQDFLEDLTELQFSVALDGDVTQSAQILLQEQGFRLYPSFAKVTIAAFLQKQTSLGESTIDDYYMDTDYNSDPDLFQVREILLNVVLTNP